MENLTGKICPICMEVLTEADTVTVCPVCETPHHKTCWETHGGCSTEGCPEEPAKVSESFVETPEEPAAKAPEMTETPETPPAVCTQCGTALTSEQMFCPKCGTQRAKKQYCGQCGAEMSVGQQFCAKCGWKAALPKKPPITITLPSIGKGEQTPKSGKNKKVLIGAIAAAVVVVLLAVYIVNGGGIDFRKNYADIADESWCTIAEDGTWMRIDTNPYNTEDDDKSWIDFQCLASATEKISEINRELGFSSSLEEKMNRTAWDLGRQSESNRKYTVTWTYHPDKGLEVIYEIK